MVSGPAHPRNANHAAPRASAFAAFLLALFAANEKPHTAAHKPPVALTARLRRCYERIAYALKSPAKPTLMYKDAKANGICRRRRLQLSESLRRTLVVMGRKRP